MTGGIFCPEEDEEAADDRNKELTLTNQ